MQVYDFIASNSYTTQHTNTQYYSILPRNKITAFSEMENFHLITTRKLLY